MEIRLGYDELRAAAVEVGDALDGLDETCRRSAREVDRLLGDWQGPAAAAFGAAWDDWLAGAGEVRGALRDLGEAIVATGRLAAGADRDATGSLGLLHARVGR